MWDHYDEAVAAGHAPGEEPEVVVAALGHVPVEEVV